jgi:diguanylate cyclase (GGDEF)-like protein
MGGMGTETSVLILGFRAHPSNAVTPLHDYESHAIDHAAASPADFTKKFSAGEFKDWNFPPFRRYQPMKLCSRSTTMSVRANLSLRRGINLRSLASLRPVWWVGFLFAALMAAQMVGYVVLGTGRSGSCLSEFSLVLMTVLAIGCTWMAFRRARGITALFWFLFAVDLMVILVPTFIQAYDTLLGQMLLPDSTRDLLFCLYGAPVLMMLFLPAHHRRARVRYEIFLDLFQVAIVVSLIYSTFFFLPVQRMLPADALLHDITFSDVQCWILLIAVFVRLQFVGIASNRGLLLRLALFLLVCAAATYIGDRIQLRGNPVFIAWADLVWAVPMVAAGLVAITWTPSPEHGSSSAPENLLSFLGSNLVLIAMLLTMGLLMDRWKQAYGETLTNLAIAASLFAFTFRLALTQFYQQQEIAQRKVAQEQLSVAHREVGRLLDESHRQTAEITQISELGSLLQACTSREEVFRLIPERLRRLFPGASGCISLFSRSRNRVESAAEWGVCATGQIFSPEQCWGLRRGCAHVHAGGLSDPRCTHLLGQGASVCIPLIANADAIGILSIQNDDPLTPSSEAEPDPKSFARRRQLAAGVAEHIAVAVANLNLREALRLQAVRDPLTGLYNRRYMQEFLDRELNSARRKHRPLAVMMLDLDHFKRYNDHYGHSAGDQALAAVGETLLRCVRAEDVACRYGGEEFALILPECSLQQATARAEEILKRLREYGTTTGRKVPGSITVSIGVAAYDETTDRVDLLLKFADEALYQAKRNGRNCVVVADPASVLLESDGPAIDSLAIHSTEAN